MDVLEEDLDCVLDLFCSDDLWGLGFRGGLFVGLPSSGSAWLAILFAFDSSLRETSETNVGPMPLMVLSSCLIVCSRLSNVSYVVLRSSLVLSLVLCDVPVWFCDEDLRVVE